MHVFNFRTEAISSNNAARQEGQWQQAVALLESMALNEVNLATTAAKIWICWRWPLLLLEEYITSNEYHNMLKVVKLVNDQNPLQSAKHTLGYCNHIEKVSRPCWIGANNGVWDVPVDFIVVTHPVGIPDVSVFLDQGYSANGKWVVWVGGLDSWDPRMKGIVT